ncbi:hypothetical protein EVAR_91140_1 [Eumeta japonica]|uniref:Uncharacterized protein n=1 Tax=Eumeta variegata TaxID=151549 RepID=A0A4C2A1K6_EUMVA|nr:hypothetical protein EVAR_91140_1 [Eumeta japonica]
MSRRAPRRQQRGSVRRRSHLASVEARSGRTSALHVTSMTVALLRAERSETRCAHSAARTRAGQPAFVPVGGGRHLYGTFSKREAEGIRNIGATRPTAIDICHIGIWRSFADFPHPLCGCRCGTEDLLVASCPGVFSSGIRPRRSSGNGSILGIQILKVPESAKDPEELSIILDRYKRLWER